ncbi:MAG: transcriptional regulator GlxA family with amidase domain [Phenylobacterium sp.]|jgi:transcriptional regulator GlxA family with amidase domain
MPQTTSGLKRIAAVAYPDCVSLDLTGPLEAFNYANLLGKEETGRDDIGYTIEILAKEPGPVQTMSGVKIHADSRFDNFDQPLDILLVPGMKFGTQTFLDNGLAQWIGTHAPKCQRVVSVCSGALILAHSGILANHKVTTHWNHGDIIRDNFTDIEVDDSQIYCKSGKIYSSAGVTAGIDLALSIIEEDFGRSLALKIAKRMVVFLKRPGDQSQFSNLLASQSKAKRFAELIDWIEKNLAQNLTVTALAERCAMSPRNFSRNFTTDVGHSPMQYISFRRLEWARLLLEETDQPLQSIPLTTGFTTLSSFNSAFKEAFHTTPGQYRKRFQ